MFSFFIRSIAFQLRKERSVIFLFVLGICVCILCVLSTMGNFGYSANNIIKQKEYSTITFNPDENTAKNARAVIDYADSLSRQGLYNVILVTPLGEGKYVLGWLGYGYDFWMAPSSGRFFSEEEQQKGQNVAYVSECIVNHLEDPQRRSRWGAQAGVTWRSPQTHRWRVWGWTLRRVTTSSHVEPARNGKTAPSTSSAGHSGRVFTSRLFPAEIRLFEILKAVFTLARRDQE